jgi:uncharacterized membrane protein YfcA
MISPELLFAEALLGLVIGLTLGLLGGGGSILTVPALVYVIGLSPRAAVTASLIIVGLNGISGAFFQRTHGTLNWQVALLFGGVGMGASYVAAGLSKSISPTVLMVAFALLMVGIGILMLWRKPAAERERPTASLPLILLTGAGVGLVTGFLGVGGGFLIVPALVLLVGLPMKQAVGTSLIVIAMNSLAGFVGHLGEFSLDIVLLAVFIVAGIGGTYLGTRLARRSNPLLLRQLFAAFIIGLGLILLMDNVSKLLA